MKTAKDLQRELGGGLPKDALPLEKLVGKEIIVTGAEEKPGPWGPFYVMSGKIGNKKFSTAVGSVGLVDLLEAGEFPFKGTIVKKPSKNRKGKFFYAWE